MAANGNVYVADWDNDRIQYFTPTGSFKGTWGTHGSANGRFNCPTGVAVAPNGRVYVADSGNDRIQFFTAAGSFLGKWGKWGSNNGDFHSPRYVALSPSANRVYVTDSWNSRVQYFRKSDPSVNPTSLGKVKALFR